MHDEDKASQKESDGSGTLFSMYLGRAKEDDDKMVDSWKGDADGMLVFVSRQTTSNTSPHNVISDWSILCCGRDIASNVPPEHSAEPASHLKLLSCIYLSANEWVPTSLPVGLF